MKKLYVEIFAYEEGDIISVPLETLIALFVYKYCEKPTALVTLVYTSQPEKVSSFSIKIFNDYEIAERNKVDPPGSFCKFPVIVSSDNTTVVAGLCAVLRHILKISDIKHPLLGFKQSCLYACAEFSIWTKFCEVDIVNAVNNLFLRSWEESTIDIPVDLLRFEMHMRQPVRIHNIQKQKQKYARASGITNFPNPCMNGLMVLPELDHLYAEGPEMTLSDVILFPCFHLIMRYFGSAFLEHHIPLTYAWYANMLLDNEVISASEIILEVEKKLSPEIYISSNTSFVPNQSLYKSDPKRSKPRSQIYTRQEDIDNCFEIIKEIGATINWDEFTFGSDVPFDWASVPFDAQPEGGELPAKRSERKGQQLENMVKAVLKIAVQGDIIVDFCSGSGHLGLILAHSLPRCTVILLENKEESLKRARERALKLKLSNVLFCQSNVDYFCGNFTIGVSLHACGVATDLVMERCIQEKAAFVCCPCCYGNIQPNHMIIYPRSQKFRSSRLELKDYLVLGHSSDQTHDQNNVKTSQGNKCMALIDTDRCLRAKEADYVVSLSKLNPTSCTPKNNLLVGIPSLRQRSQIVL